MKTVITPAMSRVSIAIYLGVLLCYSMMPLRISAPNERSRLYLTVAMVERQSFNIDAERGRFGRMLDEASYGGHFYSDKAPGASLLASPAYLLLSKISGSEGINVGALLLLGRYAVMVPLSILGYWVFEALARSLSIRERIARAFALVWLLATPAFHYGAAFFGHQVVAVCWLLTTFGLVKRKKQAPLWRSITLLGAGAALGFAQLTEYQALIGTVVLSIFFAVSCGRDWLRESFWFALGLLPCVLFFAYYHQRCFGAPFEPSYHHLVHRELSAIHGQGIGGVVRPTIDAFVGSLFSLHRGLFAVTPLLLAAPLGVWCLWRRGYGAFAITSFALCALSILFVSSSLTWEAGWGYGSRLLVPTLPFLVLSVAFAAEYWGNRRLLWSCLSPAWLASLLSVQAVTACFAEPPNELQNPLLDVSLTLASAGTIPGNMASRYLGLSGLGSLVPLGLLLLITVTYWYRVAIACGQSKRFLYSVALGPILLCSVVWAKGPSVPAKGRASFIQFVRSQSDVP